MAPASDIVPLCQLLALPSLVRLGLWRPVYLSGSICAKILGTPRPSAPKGHCSERCSLLDRAIARCGGNLLPSISPLRSVNRRGSARKPERVQNLPDCLGRMDGRELIEAPPGLDDVKDELLVRTSGRSATSSAKRVSPGSECIIESLVPNLRSAARNLHAPRGSVTTQIGWWLRTKARRSSQSMGPRSRADPGRCRSRSSRDSRRPVIEEGREPALPTRLHGYTLRATIHRQSPVRC
jgi:hypothetical protein